MKKKYETRYFVTDVASILAVRVYGKTEMYRQAAKDGWGVEYRDENHKPCFGTTCPSAITLWAATGGTW